MPEVAREEDCGCAKRMRRALPKKGYRLVDGYWVNDETGDRIENRQIDVKHTSLTLQRPGLWWEAMKAVAADVIEEVRNGDDEKATAALDDTVEPE